MEREDNSPRPCDVCKKKTTGNFTLSPREVGGIRVYKCKIYCEVPRKEDQQRSAKLDNNSGAGM